MVVAPVAALTDKTRSVFTWNSSKSPAVKPDRLIINCVELAFSRMLLTVKPVSETIERGLFVPGPPPPTASKRMSSGCSEPSSLLPSITTWLSCVPAAPPANEICTSLGVLVPKQPHAGSHQTTPTCSGGAVEDGSANGLTTDVVPGVPVINCRSSISSKRQTRRLLLVVCGSSRRSCLDQRCPNRARLPRSPTFDPPIGEKR